MPYAAQPRKIHPTHDAPPGAHLGPITLARYAVGDLLDGKPPNGTTPAELGPFGDLYAEMLRAHQAGGKEAARRIFVAYAERDAEVAALRAADPEPPPPTVEAEMEHLTDLGNSKRLARLHGADLRYTEALGWLCWDGERWRRDETGEAMRRAKQVALSFYSEATEVMQQAASIAQQVEKAATAGDEKQTETLSQQQKELQGTAKALQKWAKESQARPRLDAMVALAKSEFPIAVRTEDFDADPWLLNVKNGTIDLRTGTLRPHERNDLITKLAPVAYDPLAICPTWVRFTRRIFDKNDELEIFVQRAIGYSLTGDTSEDKLFFSYGKGGNGKTTLFETMARLLGEYWQKAPTEMLMAKNFGDGIPNDVARLAGARFVVTAEIEEGRYLSESRVKDLTSRDTIPARYMRQDWFQFTPTHKLWMYGNHKPVVRGTDKGIWRRLCLIPFTVTIPEAEKDCHLLEKLLAEAAGILAWAVGGCLDWQKNGLPMPDVVRAATEAYRSESDTLGAFVEECCFTGQGSESYEVRAGDLYRAYVKWAEERSEKPINATRFGRQMGERGFQKVVGTWVTYVGIGLKAPGAAGAAQG